MKTLNNQLIVIPVLIDAEDFRYREMPDNELQLIATIYDEDLNKGTLFIRENPKGLILGTITKSECSFDMNLIYPELKGCNCNDCFVWVKEKIEAETGYLFENSYQKPKVGRDKDYSALETSTQSILYHEQWHKDIKKWQEAQSRVVDKLLIIEPIK